MSIDHNTTDRRSFLKRVTAAGGVTALAANAGCLEDDDDEEVDEDEAGDPLPSFEYFNNPEDYNPARHDLINIIAENIQEVGLDVEVEVLEWATLLSSVSDEYDFGLATWSQFPGVDPALNITSRYTSDHADEPGTGNYHGYQDERMDELIDIQNETLDEDERIDAIHEIQEMVAEELPMHPILMEMELMPHRNDQLDGWVDHIEGYHRLTNYVNVEPLDDNPDNQLRGFWTEALENMNVWDHAGLSKHQHLQSALQERVMWMTPDLEHDEELSFAHTIERPDDETIVLECHDGTWSDGEEKNAEDVEFTYQVLIDQTPSQNSTTAGFLESAELIDDDTVEIGLNEPLGIAAESLILYPIYVAPQHVWEGVDPVEDELDEDPVTGGMMTVDYWDVGQEIQLVARDDFRLDFEIEGIYWEIIPETATIWENFERGDINYITFAQPSRELHEADQEMDEMSIAEIEGSGWTHMNINMREAPLDEQAVRQAIAHSIPKETLSEEVYYDYYPPAHSYINPSYGDLHNPDVMEYDQSLESAQETLEEEGFVVTDDEVRYPAE